MMLARKPALEARVVRRWELTPAAFNGLLARLDTDPVAAGEKYEHLRRALLKFFSWHQMPEAESAVDETFDRIARRLEACQTIDDVPAFAYGVARLVRLERQRQSAAVVTSSDERLFEQAAPPETQDVEEVRDACLNRCLAELSAKDRASSWPTTWARDAIGLSAAGGLRRHSASVKMHSGSGRSGCGTGFGSARLNISSRRLSPLFEGHSDTDWAFLTVLA